ncbi:MAG: alpha/beta fold hydrolase [Planctomycetaceae bacterium]|jgi:haloalkane dehalogenase|nr:alpha/beta fold hydrolase [Planctomycetaceae bacterium]
MTKLYPFESHFFDLDGLRYHYLDEQRPRNAVNREVLFMVHGNPTWSFYWRNLITAFRDRYRVIAVDHIGCGLSDKPDESRYPFTLERRIDDSCRLIEGLNLQKITLIAHDWGGAIGMGTAVRLPERFDRFVLMNTAAFRGIQCPLRIRICRIPGLGRLLVQGLNLFAKSATRMAIAKRKGLSKEVRNGLTSPYNSWANRTALYRFVMDIPLSPKHPTYKTLANIEEALPKFRDKPICLIWGMLDWCFTPDYLKRFLQFYPEADVHRLNDAHHYLVEDAPDDVINALNEFLKQRRNG